MVITNALYSKVAANSRPTPWAASKAIPVRSPRCSPRRVQQSLASGRRLTVTLSSEAAAAVTTTATTPAADPQQQAEGLLELNKDTFNDYIQSAGDQVVVVDFFTDWCGPCKLIYPELVKLSGELAPAATIVKFNCNQANKELAKTLGIKVAPTFHIYKNGQKVADMTGAKVDKLRALIADHLQPADTN